MKHVARLVHCVLPALAFCLALVVSAPARADQWVLKHPGHHPRYDWELEPHAIVGVFDPPGPSIRGGGVGARATIVLVDNGFVKSINNSVGVGFGADLMFGRGVGLWVPVVMQWNFWLSRNWSVFGEPGLGMHFGRSNFGTPVLYLGGRFRLSEDIALTMRIGYPHFTIGASFYL
jgi:hypothetical protein